MFCSSSENGFSKPEQKKNDIKKMKIREIQNAKRVLKIME